jgi:hypothetical protein
MDQPRDKKQLTDLLRGSGLVGAAADDGSVTWCAGWDDDYGKGHMSKADRISALAEYLKSEGYVPKIDEDGDLSFKYEGSTYWILLDESDPEFFRIALPNFWDIENDEERRKIVNAAVRASSDVKVGKVYPVEDDTWASVEIFAPSVEAFRQVFARSMTALQHVIREFVDRMREDGA